MFPHHRFIFVIKSLRQKEAQYIKAIERLNQENYIQKQTIADLRFKLKYKPLVSNNTPYNGFLL